MDEQPVRLCSHPGCDRAHKAKGYCDLHYKRFRRGVDLDAPVREVDPSQQCSVEGCGRVARFQDKCGTCSSNWRINQAVAKARKVELESETKAPLVTQADFSVWHAERKQRVRGRSRLRKVGGRR